MTGGPPPSEPGAARRRAGFERLYATHPDRFGGPPSPFSAWAAEVVAAEGIREGRWVDLGCGLGRDARRFARDGFDVLATDYATTAIARARADPSNPPNLRFEAFDAATAVQALPAGSVSAVYAHALYMMLPDAEFAAVLHDLSRILRPGGLHLFAVRATSDPAATAASLDGPTVRPLGPSGPARPSEGSYRFFDLAAVDLTTARSGLARLRAEHAGSRHFWYVADRRP